MACVALTTGSQFLGSTLAHLDCQARVIGAYGYGALADPASGVSLALTGLLTVFIALFGIRLMLGYPIAGRDVVGEAIRLGLVLTLALSWPAWRTIGYNLVIDGPAEIATSIGGASALPGTDGTMIARLQNADDGIVAMTMYGTGRLTGGVVGGSDLGDSFHGVALADETGLGWGRVLFLVGTIGPFAITRLGAGIMLALAPLMAGLMLFGQTIGLFIGWLRALCFTALASLALSLCQGVELALLDPWIADVLHTRNGQTFTPSAPTELIVLALAFVGVNFGLLALIARLAFMAHTHVAWRWPGQAPGQVIRQANAGETIRRDQASPQDLQSRAEIISGGIAGMIRREGGDSGQALADRRLSPQIEQQSARDTSARQEVGGVAEPLGSSFRRAQRRTSAAGRKRDGQ